MFKIKTKQKLYQICLSFQNDSPPSEQNKIIHQNLLIKYTNTNLNNLDKPMLPFASFVIIMHLSPSPFHNVFSYDEF